MLVDQYPLPRPDDIFSSLREGVYFSKLDLSQAHFQQWLDEESRKLVTINTIQGLYRYTRLPFGVARAPAKFKQLIDNLLVELPCVWAYLDGIMVFRDTKESMWKNVCAVFNGLNLQTCYFNCQSVSFQWPNCPSWVTPSVKMDSKPIMKRLKPYKKPATQLQCRCVLFLDW